MKWSFEYYHVLDKTSKYSIPFMLILYVKDVFTYLRQFRVVLVIGKFFLLPVNFIITATSYGQIQTSDIV